ncbi:MAG: hypothetical protein PF508_16465 [Spirochaeta sp.]|jgi:hypothetical protein|nr:hypothetical protein [Spirochaeta sp.]
MIDYLKGKRWSDWTRDERFFCSVLYNLAKDDVTHFATIVKDYAGLSMAVSGDWDIGYEVSFYRDYLWQQGLKAAAYNVSSQRAFDLCLFGEHTLVIIEAKVYEAFSPRQNHEFGFDKDRLNKLPGLEKIDVRLVALASSTYFKNQKHFGRGNTLNVFDGRITWEQMYQVYKDPLLRQADEMYKATAGKWIP